MLGFKIAGQRTLLQPTWAAAPNITRPRVSAQKQYVDVTVPLPGLIARDVDVACDGASVTVRARTAETAPLPWGGRASTREVARVKLPCRASAGEPPWLLRQGLLCVRIARAVDAEKQARTLGERMRGAWIALTGRMTLALRRPMPIPAGLQ